MGKKRKGGNVKNTNTNEKKKHRRDEPKFSLLDPTDRSFIYDAVDDFHDHQEEESLQTAMKLMERKGPSREQVLGIDGSSSDDDESDVEESADEENQDELYMEDDIVDEAEEELPDERAWGNKKHRYFGTDTTDERINWNVYNQDEEMAKLEEETARKLQERMAAELEDLAADDLIIQADDKDRQEDAAQSSVEADISSLSRSRKLQLLKRESPEFLPVIEDLKSKCEEVQCILNPLMERVKNGKIADGPVKNYIMTKYRLVLNYISTISMYMLLKCSTKSLRDHPVVSRLAQYRQLLKELETCDNKLASHLGQLLSAGSDADDDNETDDDNEDDDDSEDDDLAFSPPKIVKENPRRQKKELAILKNKKAAKLEEKKKLMALLKDPVDDKAKGKSKSKKRDLSNVLEASSDEEPEANDNDVTEADSNQLDPDQKRGIGYDISKNKGLMPYRRKDMQNPRVRYRSKYSKKLKKRKSQFAGVRKEVNRYEGEMTGIKSHTIKSIKIKS